MLPIKYKAARTAGTGQAAQRCEEFCSSIRTPILSQYYKNVYSVYSVFLRGAA